MADDAIQYMKQLKEIAPDKPFFVYYVPGGTHAPHHPTPEWIKKISDMHLFDGGWNKIRETIFANQKKLGIMPAECQVDRRGRRTCRSGIRSSWEQKKLFIKQADVYGAYLAYTDNEIGRVIQAVEDMGELDNTLIIYISGDNGASAEGMLNGTPTSLPPSMALPCRLRISSSGTSSGDRTRPSRTLPRLGVGVRHAVQMVQASRVAFRRDGAGHGHVVARSH